MLQNGLYYGPPDQDHYCAYLYVVAGQPRHDLRCPNRVDFYVKVPDGRDDWRKAWAACADHLNVVVWQMQEQYGGTEFYTRDYLLRAFASEDGEDGLPERIRDGGEEPEVQVPEP